MFTVGQGARAAAVSAKAVRLYEARGLLPVAARTAAGYRVFEASDVDTVRLIHRVRIGAWPGRGGGDPGHPQRSGAVRRTGQLLEHRIAEIDPTLRELRGSCGRPWSPHVPPTTAEPIGPGTWAVRRVRSAR